MQRFIFNDVLIQKIRNTNRLFCEQQPMLFIIPQKNAFKKAKTLCEIHGGSLVIPESDDDQDEIFNILSRHRTACLDKTDTLNKGKAIWLGMERIQKKWYTRDFKNNQIQLINYTKWDPEQCTTEICAIDNKKEVSCPYMEDGGMWAFGLNHGFCHQVELCVVCSFTEAPVYSVKGMCSEDTLLNWNFYININERYQIVGYDGYKTSKITRSNEEWKMQDNGVIANTSADYPIGRKDWNYKDRTCGMKSFVKTSLTLSLCYPGKEFTCDSGHCIPLFKRCNQMNDCEDGSDEENCNMVNVPTSYNKLISPGFHGKNNGTPIGLLINVNIISIDLIDTVKMCVGITFDTKIKWTDGRLNFENMDQKGKNLISVKSEVNFWIPSDNIIHYNAVIGEIIEDKDNRVVHVTNLTAGIRYRTTESIENYLYPGENTKLVMMQKFKIIYRCTFDVTKFPFDKHRCSFTIKLSLGKKDSAVFMKNGEENAVEYKGSSTWNQFRIHDIRSEIINDVDESTIFEFSIGISRVNTNQMLNIFLPSMLLLSLAYSTLFIDLDNFSDRFTGTITSLLVLVSLLSSVNEDLPKTSYFKFIDLWFLWYISTILVITLFHIFLSHVSNIQIIYQNRVIDMNRNTEQSKHSLRYRVNRFGMILFAMGTIIFEIVYFVFTV